MIEGRKISVIMPAYNEAAVIGDVLDKLLPMAQSNGWEVLVVDDGSEDGTGKIATEHGAKVLTHPYNRGYGASLKTGLHSCCGEIVVIMDSDGQHDENDIPRLLGEIEDYDMVVGERTKGSHNDWLRKPGKWVLGKTANMLSGLKIPDLNSGLRAYKKDLLLKLIHLMPDGFSFSTTSTVAYSSMNFRIKYIPIKVKARVGTSTVRQFRHGFETILLMLRLIVLFNPLKVFLPMSVAMLLMGVIYQFYIIYKEGLHIRGGTIVALTAGVQCFLFGLMIDQISSIRREKFL
ncbi:MAG: glycosyltransferase family 2 protein [Sedimentisphaerales bacterium]|nr:glycosyltransferase family 2 protein [Sedimentisphaerales bacterium]